MNVLQYIWILSLRINMYSEGLMDLMEMIMMLPFSPDAKSKLGTIQTKAKERYLPVYEKVPAHLFYISNGLISDSSWLKAII